MCNRQYPKTYFVKMLSFFAGGFCIVILLMSILVSSVVQEAVIRQNREHSQRLLLQIRQYVENLNEAAKLACRRIYVSPDTALLMTLKNDAIGELYYQTVLAMKRIRQSSMYVDHSISSIVLYNGQINQFFQTRSGINDADSFYVQAVKNPQLPLLEPIYRKRTDEKEAEIVYCIYEKDIFGKIESAAFVSIDVAWITKNLSDVLLKIDLDGKDGLYLINNSKDVIVSARGNNIDINSIIFDPSFDVNKQVDNVYKILPDNKEYCVYGQAVDNAVMHLIYVQQMKNVMIDVYRVQRQLFIVFLSSVLLSVATVVIISIFLYRPIHSLTQQVYDSSQDIETNDEFSILREAYSSIESMQLQIRKHECSNLLRKFLLFGCNEESDADIISQIFRMGNCPYYRILNIQIKNIDDENHEGIFNDFRDCLLEAFPCEYYSPSLSAGIYICGQNTNDSPEKFSTILSKALSHVQSNYGIDLIIGVSGCAAKFDRIVELRLQAEWALSMHYYLENATVLYVDDLICYTTYAKKKSLSDVFYAEDQLIAAIRSNKKEELQTTLNTYIDYIRFRDVQERRLIIAHFIDSIKEIVTHLNQIRMDPLTINFNTIQTQLIHINTFREFTSKLSEICESLFKETSISLEEKHYTIAMTIVEIIQQEFSNTELCLTSISNQLNYSPNYVARIFKFHTGMSVSTFINNLRLDKAAQMLETTNMKINDILEIVGFSNQSNFYKLFKQKFGITPKEYSLRQYSNRR